MSKHLSLPGTIYADMKAYADFVGKPLRSPADYIDALMIPGVVSVILFRLTTYCHDAGLRPLSRILYFMNVVLFGSSLPPSAEVGPGLVIPHPVGMGFSSNVKIGSNVTLFAGSLIGAAGYEDRSKDGLPTIGDGAFIFTRAQVVGPVNVGNDAIIGANAVVMKDVPPGAIVLGAPGRVVRYRDGFGPKVAEGEAADSDAANPAPNIK
jgi:serine O-acetyltransferase